jgi:hypothetical protein
MATIYREFFHGVHLGCRILIPATAALLLLLALR